MTDMQKDRMMSLYQIWEKNYKIMENIKENNKLISEFLYPNFVHPKNKGENWEKENADVSAVNGNWSAYGALLMEDYIQLNYHKSWNNLIPALKKIMEFDIDKYKESPGWYAYYSIETFIVEFELEKIYEEAIIFINWLKDEKIKIL